MAMIATFELEELCGRSHQGLNYDLSRHRAEVGGFSAAGLA